MDVTEAGARVHIRKIDPAELTGKRAGGPIRAALARQWPPMSQVKLANELGMSQSVLSAYVNGRRVPPEGFILAAARVLGCDPDELRSGETVAA